MKYLLIFLIIYSIGSWIYGAYISFCYMKPPVRLNIIIALIITIGSPFWIILFYLSKLFSKITGR